MGEKKEKVVTKEMVEASLYELNLLSQYIFERKQKLEQLLKEMEEGKTIKTQPVEFREPTEKQIAYAMILARKAKKDITEEELKRMDREDVSKLIEQLKEKLEQEKVKR
jgi:anaerobic ribonucleoside-triphosphate reductase